MERSPLSTPHPPCPVCVPGRKQEASTVSSSSQTLWFPLSAHHPTSSLIFKKLSQNHITPTSPVMPHSAASPLGRSSPL